MDNFSDAVLCVLQKQQGCFVFEIDVDGFCDILDQFLGEDAHLLKMYDLLFKFISVGDSGVGKSCLLLRYINKEFQSTETTIGIEFGSSVVTIGSKQIKLQIWDTAGQESFRSISRAYYRGAIGCLLVFDVTRRETFHHVKDWLADVQLHGNDKTIIILVANKCDLTRQGYYQFNVVTTEQAEAFAAKNNLMYIETSARKGTNVDQAFEMLANRVYDTFDLSRSVSQMSDVEIKTLESHGVKVGPRRPAIMINPLNSASTSDSCCSK